MKNSKSIVVALLIGACPAAWAQYSTGTNDLAHTNLSGALTAFTNTAASDPNAAVYLALTRLLTLPTNDASSGNILGELGVSSSGRDIYKWEAAPKKNANGHVVLPTSFNPDDITTELISYVVPAEVASEKNLASVTSTSFTLRMPRTVTHFGGDVTLDYGDVQMLRAMLDAHTVLCYEISSWNLNANYGKASNIVETDNSILALLTNFPSLLTITSSSDLASARAAFTNAASAYFAASQFIRNRPAGSKFLFNLDANEVQREANFRTTLSNLVASLNGPVALSSTKTNKISLKALFSGDTSVRSWLPTFTGNKATFIWDSFPDTTLGGFVTGLTQTNLGKLFLKQLGAQTVLSKTNLTYSVISSAPEADSLEGSLNGVVLGTDGNLYGTASYGGAYGRGAFFQAATNGGFKLLYSFGAVTNRDGSPTDGGSPSSLVLGSDNNFYGTTSYGGANQTGTIFKITTSGTLTTLYNFGSGNDYSSSGGNPLLLGEDGNFYGATQYGGTNGQGIIFEFIPPSANGANGGNFITLCSLPKADNPYGSGASTGALIQDQDGYFYGCTQFGGANGAGSLFKFVPGVNGNGGTFYTGYSFPQLYDPYGNPITLNINTPVLGTNGVFYGTTQYGGNNYGNGSGGEGDGTLFSVDTNGNFTTLYNFDENGFHGFGPIGAMVQGTNGAFYGITSSGGANGRGTLFKYTPGDAAPDFIVWFGSSLGAQQSEQDGNSGGNTVYAGLTKGHGRIYGTAPEDGPAKNGSGVVFSISANSDVSPSIVSSPASTTNVVGSNVVLTVSATGTSPLKYQWERSGSSSLPSNVSGSSSSSLTFSSLNMGDAGSYVVVVSNTNGSATSAPAVLTVVAVPKIFTPPAASTNVAQGRTFNLWVGVGTNLAGLTYQWLLNGVALTNGLQVSGETVSGATATNLLITSASANDSGSYTVVVSNPFSSVTSQVSKVTVGGAPMEAFAMPANSTNVAGSNATLTVMVEGGTLPHYQWKKIAGGATNNVSGATNSTLGFTNLTLANSGSYFVVVTNVFGSVTSTVAVLTVVNGPYVTSLAVSPAAVVRGQALSLKAAATGGGLVWQWKFNATNILTNGGPVSGATGSNLVIFPADSSNSGTYTVVVTNTVGSTNKSLAVTVLADTHAPSVTVSSPAAGARTNAVTFAGTASEEVSGAPVLITNVNYWITNLNGAPLAGGAAAGLSNGTVLASNWTAAITPYPGSNIFAAQSRDFSGRTSAVVTLKFFLKSEVPLTVITNTGSGSGSAKVSAKAGQDVLPADGGLYVGESYSITATPKADSYFVNWTANNATLLGAATNATVDFIMESNAVLTAHFTTNIFLGMAGTYNGLFSSQDLGVTEETAGMIYNLALKTNGAYSGTLRLNGSAPAISGRFSPQGHATNTLVSTTPGNNYATVELTVTNTTPRQITGRVIGTNTLRSNGVPVKGWVSQADLFASTNNTKSDAGAYTLLLPPSAPNMPPGYGYALLTNNPGTATVAPSVTIVGALADDSPVTPSQPIFQNVPIGEDNGIPIYQNPYSNGVSGLLWGRLSLTGASAPTGELTWIRKQGAAALGGEFDAGFTNIAVPVLGSYWSNAVLPAPQMTQLVVSNGGLTVALTNEVVLHTTNLVSATNGFKSATYNPNNGKLTITFTNAGKQVTGYGALLQDGAADGILGGGFFILGPTNTPTNAGTILLQP